MNVLEQIFEAIPSSIGTIITWGQVISITPTQVRFAGDTNDVPVSLRLGSYTPTAGDKVALLKIGAQWVVLGKIVSG